MELPTKEQILNNLDDWKQYNLVLTDMIEKIESEQNDILERNRHIFLMHDMFETYVKKLYPSKRFYLCKVFCFGNKLYYDHDDVQMYHVDKMIWVIDDTIGYFVDRKIIVNGIIILDEVKE